MQASKLIFMDTWAWLALANRRDRYHEPAKKTYFEVRAAKYQLVTSDTSDYILDEVITALFMNIAFDSAVKFVESLLAMVEDGQLELERITGERFKQAWLLRKRYSDKPDISFTDLTSFVEMQNMGIKKAFTGDSHFEAVNLGFEILPK